MVASAWVPISVRVELVGLDVHVVKVSYLTTLNLKGSKINKYFFRALAI